MTIDSQKRILNLTVVSSYFYPKIGGLETIAYLTSKKIHQDKKYNVSIITTNYDGRGYKKEIIDGMTVHKLPIMFKISNTPINPFWFFTIRRILREEKTDIVQTHSPVPFMADIAIYIARKISIPTVFTYHSGSMKKGKIITDLVISIYEKFILNYIFNLTSKIVTVHEPFMKKNYSSYNNKTYFIPTGVDLERFNKTNIPNEKTKYVTYIGRIELTSMWKGIDYLMKAMVNVIKKYPDTKLQLVGSGDALEYYKKLSLDLSIADNVSILGPKFGDDLVKVYKNSSVVVLPSVSDSEAFSVTLVESMASGRPVIGTEIGGTPQVIKNGQNGLLVRPRSIEELTTAIIKIVSDIEYAQKLGDVGAEMAKNFTWDIQTRKYLDLYENLLNK